MKKELRQHDEYVNYEEEKIIKKHASEKRRASKSTQVKTAVQVKVCRKSELHDKAQIIAFSDGSDRGYGIDLYQELW